MDFETLQPDLDRRLDCLNIILDAKVFKAIDIPILLYVFLVNINHIQKHILIHTLNQWTSCANKMGRLKQKYFWRCICIDFEIDL